MRRVLSIIFMITIAFASVNCLLRRNAIKKVNGKEVTAQKIKELKNLEKKAIEAVKVSEDSTECFVKNLKQMMDELIAAADSISSFNPISIQKHVLNLIRAAKNAANCW